MTIIVSVIMPVYNMAEFVKKAIDSILQQSFSCFELIVVDDASEDGTAMIVQSYTDRRIVYERNVHNIGNYASRNKAFQKVRGKYVAVMDADDIARVDRLERQVSYLENHLDLLAVGSDCIFISNGNLKKVPSSYQEIQIALLRNNCFYHSSLMIRTNILLKLKGYDEKYYYSADYDLVCRLALQGKVENLAEPLIKYRQHPIQISVLHREKQFMFANEIRRNYQLAFINRYKKKEQTFVTKVEVSVSSIGLAIAYYTYARYSDSIKYKQDADELLDEIFSNLSDDMFVKSENILLGIVCGVIYLLHNNFVKGDEDEVFEEVDEALLENLVSLIEKRDLDSYRWLYYLRLCIFRKCKCKRRLKNVVFRKSLVALLDYLIDEMKRGWLPNEEIFSEIKWFHEKKVCFERTSYILSIDEKN